MLALPSRFPPLHFLCSQPPQFVLQFSASPVPPNAPQHLRTPSVLGVVPTRDPAPALSLSKSPLIPVIPVSAPMTSTFYFFVRRVFLLVWAFLPPRVRNGVSGPIACVYDVDLFSRIAVQVLRSCPFLLSGPLVGVTERASPTRYISMNDCWHRHAI